MIALMMEAASTSETSVNFFQTTRRKSPADSHIYIPFISLNTRHTRKNVSDVISSQYLNEIYILSQVSILFSIKILKKVCI
jgi:hypothetical protein